MKKKKISAFLAVLCSCTMLTSTFATGTMTVLADDTSAMEAEEITTESTTEEASTETVDMELSSQTDESVKEEGSTEELSTEPLSEEEGSTDTADTEVSEDNIELVTASSGSCGTNATYSLSDLGILTISGSGAINDSAFAGNTSIKVVKINSGITRIGSEAFENCTALTSISIPNSVTEMGAYVFNGATDLKTLTLPSTIKTMIDNVGGYHGSLNGSSVQKVIFSAGTTSIPYLACSGAASLTSVVLPSGVTTIQARAFEETALSSISLPSSLTTMEANIFLNVSTLKTLEIPAKVKTMQSNDGGYHGSLNGSYITTLSFKSGMTKIPDYAAQGAAHLTSVSIPSDVTTLGLNSFYECSSLTSITLPSKLSTIGGGSFAESGLKSLTIPSSVTKIEGRILEKNTGVTSLTIPKNVKTMRSNIGGYHGSLYGSNVKSVTFTDGIATIPASACSGAESLTSVKLPNSVTKIEERAFENTSLTAITLPSSLTTMESRLFAGVSTLKNISIPSTVTSMFSNDGGYHGALCDSYLTNVSFQKGITAIPAYAAQGATYLNTVSLPSTITKIGEDAFYECERLTSISLPSKLTAIDGEAFAESGLKSLSIPSKVTTLGGRILEGNTGVTSLTIPKNVKTMYSNIGGYHGALYGSSVTSVTFADGMTKIPDYAMHGASYLKKAFIPVSAETFGSDILYNAGNVTFHCYKKSAAATYAKNNNINVKYIGTAQNSTITASNRTKTTSASAQSFSIGAKIDGKGAVSYKSDNKKITVNNNGKVTIAKNYIGKATITIRVASAEEYRAASKKITVTAAPAKTTLGSVKNASGQKMTVSWKKGSSINGYQIQYSVNSNFKSSSKATVSNAKTTSKTISSLKKGKTYYVRIRTYKTINGEKIYSGWSDAKKVKINK